MLVRKGWVFSGAGLAAAALLAGLAGPGSAAWAPPPGLAREAGASGSAFLVAPGLLVTNLHVVLRCRAQGLPLAAGRERLPLRLLAEDSGADLALLGGAPERERPLRLSAARRLPPGLPVVMLGYPTAGAAAGGLRATPGEIRRASLTVHDPATGRATSFVPTDHKGREVAADWADGLRYFGAAQAERLRWRLEIGAETGGGNSGGPVLDAAGQVVGVVYAGGRGSTSAVPLDDLREFLARAGVTPLFGAPAPPGTSPDGERLQEHAAGATWRVRC